MDGAVVRIGDGAAPAADTWSAKAAELADQADSLTAEIAASISRPWWGSDSAAATVKASVDQLGDFIHGADFRKAMRKPTGIGDAVVAAIDNSYASDQTQAAVVEDVRRSISQSTAQ